MTTLNPPACNVPGPPRVDSFHQLWRLVRAAEPSGPMLVAAVTAALVGVGGTLWSPMLAKQVVDELASATANPAGILLLAGVLVGSTITSAISAYLLARVGCALVASLRCRLIEKLLRLPVGSFDRESTGERVSRVVSDCEAISGLVTRQAVNVLIGGLLLAGSVVMLLLLDLRLTLTLLGCVAASFAVVVPASSLLAGLSRRIQDRTAKLSGILTHVLSEVRLVKAFTAEARERERSCEEVEGIKRLGLHVAGIDATLGPLMTLATTAAIIVILIYGTSRVSRGEIGIGTLIAFILCTFNITTPLVQLAGFAAELQRAKGASGRIGAILIEAEEEVDRGDVSRQDSGTVSRQDSGTLEFRDVSFAYPGQSSEILQGIDLVFRPGTTTALVGASGNGKTTILSLIERFYEPTRGGIHYGGRPVSDLALAAWRGRIGYVPQGAPIMPGSVRDNIVYGMTGDCSDEMVRMGAERAGALSFIERLPGGFDTVLTEQGSNLSGGQRQRIAIARMFLRNPDILILDEATSNLDSETEYHVRLALQSLMRGRTNIIVAHRLATIMHADRIYLLEGGRISGVGKHDELVATHRQYARMVERQFRRVPEDAVLN